jgi:alpha-L-arabinofuranosidase
VLTRAALLGCSVAALFGAAPIGCADVVVPLIGSQPSDASADGYAPSDATGTDPTLAGYWNFEEGIGVIAVDSSGHGNNGSLQGGATWGPGKVGNHCLALNSAGAFVDIPNAVVDTSRPYSVSAWINLSVATGNQTVVSIDGNSDSAFFFKQHAAGVFTLEVRASDNATAPVAASASASTQTAAGTWYYFTGVFDGSTIYLYVDGALHGNAILTTPWRGLGHTFIGRSKFMGAYGDDVTGAIDEVRIYSRALTASDVLALYRLE